MSVPHTSSPDGGPPNAAALVGPIDASREPAPPVWAGADLTNVVAFPKLHRREGQGEADAQVCVVAGERSAPALPSGQRWMPALLLGSLGAHAGIYWMLSREPPPLASIGIETMSVEIVLGTDMPAGRAQEPAKIEQEPAQPPTEPVQDAAQPEPKQEAVQQTEPAPSPPAEAAPAASDAEQPPVPSDPVPAVLAIPPNESGHKKAAVAPPTHARKRVEPAAAHSSKPQHPVRQRQAMLPAVSGAPASSPSGIGRGRSDVDTNYHGLVAAHLARYKRFPADARSRGDQGVAAVSFQLDGAGRVSSVALVRGSGVASFDQEVQSMVHRASPFPAPPSGRPMSFTVPVSFRLQ